MIREQTKKKHRKTEIENPLGLPMKIRLKLFFRTECLDSEGKCAGFERKSDIWQRLSLHFILYTHNKYVFRISESLLQLCMWLFIVCCLYWHIKWLSHVTFLPSNSPQAICYFMCASFACNTVCLCLRNELSKH